MSSEQGDKCKIALEQLDVGMCWFISILHSVFFSERVRSVINKQVAELKSNENNSDFAKYVQDVYNYRTNKTESKLNVSKQVCYDSVKFLSYLLFQSGTRTNLHQQATMYKMIEKSIEKQKGMKNYEKLVVPNEDFTVTALDNYDVRCNKIRDIRVSQIVGGVPQDFILPFLTHFLGKQEVLHFDIFYDDLLLPKNTTQTITKPAEFDDVIDCIMNAIPQDTLPDVLILSCSAGNNVTIPTQLSKAVDMNRQNKSSLPLVKGAKALTKYTLESAIFGISIGENSGHAIAGVKCDGKPYILDSATGKAHEVDWINKRSSAIDEYIQDFREDYLEAYDTNEPIHYAYSPDNSDVYIYVLDKKTGGRKKATSNKLENYIASMLHKRSKATRKAKIVEKVQRKPAKKRTTAK